VLKSLQELYKQHNLPGGHVIMLGPGNEEAAMAALKAYPGGLQIGGGINPTNAQKYLDAGASHVIVTSYVFNGGKLDQARWPYASHFAFPAEFMRGLRAVRR
jgi:phosphoribosylformimino-5-aminoimidazole carboxamide ribotide isomerase